MEDLWLVRRIGVLPDARMANTTMESHFSVEQVWYNEPMGYHMGWSGARLPEDVWDDPRQREQIWKWCPEIKMILDMKLDRECRGDDFYGPDGSMQGYDKSGGRGFQREEYSMQTKRMMKKQAGWPGPSAW
jgi:hypothetical protein